MPEFDAMPKRASALAALAAAAKPVPAAALAPLPEAARFVFRAREGAIEPAGRAFGPALPREARRFVAATGRIAVWLGPDEWLLIAPGEEAAPIAAAIEAETAAAPHSLVDVSHRSVGIEVSGGEAAAVLNAGCPLDLSAEAFPVGAATRTVLAKAEIVLMRTGPETFRIDVWRSFAAYVWQYLEEARREFA
jgi:sarcosine oxidase subunit gamma